MDVIKFVLIIVSPIIILLLSIWAAAKLMHPNYDEFNEIELGDSYDTLLSVYGRVPEHRSSIDDWEVITFFRANPLTERNDLKGDDYIYSSGVFLVTDDGKVIAKCYMGEGPFECIDPDYVFRIWQPSMDDVQHLKEILASAED